MQTGGLRTGGLQTGGLRTGGLQTGGLRTGGLQTGGLRTGGLQTGGLRTGGVQGASGLTSGQIQTAEFRDGNNNGIEDRSEGINTDNMSPAAASRALGTPGPNAGNATANNGSGAATAPSSNPNLQTNGFFRTEEQRRARIANSPLWQSKRIFSSQQAQPQTTVEATPAGRVLRGADGNVIGSSSTAFGRANAQPASLADFNGVESVDAYDVPVPQPPPVVMPDNADVLADEPPNGIFNPEGFGSRRADRYWQENPLTQEEKAGERTIPAPAERVSRAKRFGAFAQGVEGLRRRATAPFREAVADTFQDAKDRAAGTVDLIRDNFAETGEDVENVSESIVGNYRRLGKLARGAAEFLPTENARVIPRALGDAMDKAALGTQVAGQAVKGRLDSNVAAIDGAVAGTKAATQAGLQALDTAIDSFGEKASKTTAAALKNIKAAAKDAPANIAAGTKVLKDRILGGAQMAQSTVKSMVDNPPVKIDMPDIAGNIAVMREVALDKLTPEKPSRKTAQFGKASETASPLAKETTNKIVQTGDNGNRPFVVADKKSGKLYAFNEKGKMMAEMNALFGKDAGDALIQNKSVTPSGKYEAKVNDASYWKEFDYGTTIDFAKTLHGTKLAIHRLYTNVKDQNRPGRLKSETADDNKISGGCINCDDAAYDRILKPMFEEKGGGTVYILPETEEGMKAFNIGPEPKK